MSTSGEENCNMENLQMTDGTTDYKWTIDIK